jgi:hypothetical protein
MLEGAQDTQLSIAVTPPALPEAAVTSRHSSEPPSPTELPEGESDRFTELPADLRAKLQGPDTTSDQRFRVLRNRIVRDEAEEEIVKYLRVNIRISKLFALAELSIRYSEEKKARSAVPKKRWKKELPQLSPKDRFTDLLFPENRQYRGGKREERREKGS